MSGDALYVTMARVRQVWRLDLKSEEIGPYAGDGAESAWTGRCWRAVFAQPTGISSDGTSLYLVEAESSVLRAVDLDPQGRVVTLAGGDLFAFGDRDGVGLLARFQHPLGLAYDQGVLYIADSYNHKVKSFTISTRRCVTLFEDADLLREPRGLAAAEGRLYIADANGHAIRVAELQTHRLTTLTLLAESEPIRVAAMPEFFGSIQDISRQTIGPGAAVLTASVAGPPGIASVRRPLTKCDCACAGWHCKSRVSGSARPGPPDVSRAASARVTTRRRRSRSRIRRLLLRG